MLQHPADHTVSSIDRNDTILSLNQTMLECVLRGDWQGYSSLCDSSVSCFEAETNGLLVEGLAFHHFYFPKSTPAVEQPQDSQVTMARPHLRWLGDDAVVVSYTRLVQRCINGDFITSSCCETRIWQLINGTWKQVHVHRS